MHKIQQFLKQDDGFIPFNRALIFLLMIPIIYVFVIDGDSVKEYLPDVVNDGIFAANQFFKAFQAQILDFLARNFNF